MVAPSGVLTVERWLAEMSVDGVPLVVCVSPDPMVREQLAGRLDGRGVVLMCPDLRALRAVLGPVADPAPVIDGWGPPVRAVTGADGAVSVGDLVVEPHGRRAVVRGRPVPLTRIECALLGRLVSDPARVWTYEGLYLAVWGGAYLGDNAILHSAVKRLRRKLRAVDAGVEIETVRGVGYRLA